MKNDNHNHILSENDYEQAFVVNCYIIAVQSGLHGPTAPGLALFKLLKDGTNLLQFFTV